MSLILNLLSHVQAGRGIQGLGDLGVRGGRSIHGDRARIADCLGAGDNRGGGFLAIANGWQLRPDARGSDPTNQEWKALAKDASVSAPLA